MSEKKYLTKNGAATLLGISRTKIDNLLSDGTLVPAKKVVREYNLFDLDDLIKFKEQVSKKEKKKFEEKLKKITK